MEQVVPTQPGNGSHRTNDSSQPSTGNQRPGLGMGATPSGIDSRVRNVMVLIACASLLISLLVMANRLGSDDEESSGSLNATAEQQAAIDQESGGRNPTAWEGAVLDVAQSKPDINLTDTDGNPYSLIEETEGQLTILMFGYTNCPDICPISLATLGSAMKDMPPEDANRIRMVFVTADPERDTPEVLDEYLGKFHPSFVGLVGTVEEIDAAQRLVDDLPIAVREEPDEDGKYAVGHATQMIAYQNDGWARIVYPFGTRAEHWKRDIPRLLNGEFPA